MGKKRKYELDLDVERTMYGSFVAAANSVSQLYTQAVQQQRRAAVTASRATLERVLAFVLRDPQGSDQISRSLLVQFLQHEYENLEHQDLTGPPAPVQVLPFIGSGAAPQREGSPEPPSAPHPGPKQPRGHPGQPLATPMPRNSSMNSRDWSSGMEEQQAAAAAAAAATAAAGGAAPGMPAPHSHPQTHSQLMGHAQAASSDMDVSQHCQHQQHQHAHQVQQQQQSGMFMPMGGPAAGAGQHLGVGMFMGGPTGMQGR